MNYKKFIIGVTLGTLFSFLPDESFSHINLPGERRGLYIATEYKVSVPNFSNFSAEETLPGLTKRIYGLKLNESVINTNTNFNRSYDPTYASNFTGISGIIGYYFGDLRIEFEGFYSNFEPEKQWNREGTQSHKFFALSRGTEDTAQNNGFIVLENNGVNNKSLNINFCYDVAHGNTPFAPYVCAGIGGDYVRFLGVSLPKFSYQLKFGVNYPISANTILFGGGYYHNVVGSKYERVEIAYHPATLSSVPKTTSASANLDTDYFGWEVGVRFAL